METSQDAVILDRFFATVNAKLDSHDQFITLVAPQLAPNFNMVSCFYPDENRLSAIIAMLLDPKGEHGQGVVFLQLFLELITADFSDDTHPALQRLAAVKDICSKELRTVRTARNLEVPTSYIDNCQRRLDILLILDGFGLAIENKPWAMDQPRQIEDYLDHLSHKNGFGDNFLLIYLSGNGEPPGVNSIVLEKRREKEKSGHFMVVEYSRLKEWCELCAEKSSSIKVRIFLDDFRDYINTHFCGGGNVMESKLLVEHSTKDENIRAAVAIARSWPAIAHNLIGNLVVLVKEQVKLDESWQNPEWDGFDIYKANTGIRFFKKDWRIYRIMIGFESTNTNNFFYGIEKIDNSLNHSYTLDVTNLDKGKYSEEWPWWQYFKEPFLNWGINNEPWLGIKTNGETVQEVVNKLNYLIENSAEKIDKAEQAARLDELENHTLQTV